MRRTGLLLPALAAALLGCSTPFAPGAAESIDVPELQSLQHLDPIDSLFYCGSDGAWHYFFRARMFGSASYKVARALLEVEAEHPLGSEAACALAAGHFDPTPTGTWVYEPSAKRPPALP
jgi:hypothetical protein